MGTGQKNRTGRCRNVLRGSRLGARVIVRLSGRHHINHCDGCIGKGTFQAALGHLEELGYEVGLGMLGVIQPEFRLQGSNDQGDRQDGDPT